MTLFPGDSNSFRWFDYCSHFADFANCGPLCVATIFVINRNIFLMQKTSAFSAALLEFLDERLEIYLEVNATIKRVIKICKKSICRRTLRKYLSWPVLMDLRKELKGQLNSARQLKMRKICVKFVKKMSYYGGYISKDDSYGTNKRTKLVYQHGEDEDEDEDEDERLTNNINKLIYPKTLERWI
uniref:Uncharacterized protein n=1 Tax=Glossina austeni TaxID=7395 RepID=A0A1A9V440_GLOAU